MTYKATALRQNLYAILDSVIDSGQAVEIERRGHRLRIVPENCSSIWDHIEEHQIVVGDPEDLVLGDWKNAWSRGRNL